MSHPARNIPQGQGQAAPTSRSVSRWQRLSCSLAVAAVLSLALMTAGLYWHTATGRSSSSSNTDSQRQAELLALPRAALERFRAAARAAGTARVLVAFERQTTAGAGGHQAGEPPAHQGSRHATGTRSSAELAEAAKRSAAPPLTAAETPPAATGATVVAPLAAAASAAVDARVTVTAAPAVAAAPAVRIYVYDLPPQFRSPQIGPEAFGDLLAHRLHASPYVTTDGDAADYYWIPTPGMHWKQAGLLALFEHVRTAYPWWNRTRELGAARHIMVFISDMGVGQMGFDRPIRLDSGLPDDINPVSPTRNVLFLSCSGYRDGADMRWTHPDRRDECITCFQQGKDIMIPTTQSVCGPLCGYSLETLRDKSVWGRNGGPAALHGSRSKRLFFCGTVPTTDPADFTGRGGIYHHYAHRSNDSYLIVRSGEHPYVDQVEAMRDSVFCYSPLGQMGGDTSRYLPSILFGCIPVMLNTAVGRPYHGFKVPQALPLEEIIDWHKFSTLIDVESLDRLDEQLRCLQHRAAAMREAMAGVWRLLLYSTVYQPYLGEDGQGDAFEGIMQVLASRVPHGYQPSPEARKRMKRGRGRFPCRRPKRMSDVLKEQQQQQHHSRK